MAHNLSRHRDENGNERHSFYSLRESAWHKLGQVVDLPVSDLDAKSLAGLNWTAEEVGLRLDDLSPVTTHKAIIRSDTKAQLGIVSAGYTPVQNEDLFDWFRGLEGFADDVVIETAGAIGKGEIVWVMAKCKGLKTDIGGDELQGYMSMTNGHGGNLKLSITPTMIKQVCQNTTRMILAQTRKDTLASGWEMRHTPNIKERLSQIRKLYAQTTEAWKKTEEVMRFLVSKPLKELDTFRLFNEPFMTEAEVKAEAEGKQETDRTAMNRANREAKCREILASPTCQLPGMKDTLFAGFNALTEYIEHHKPARSKDGTPESANMSRFESANFGGEGDKAKSRGFALAMELAGA